MLPFQFSLRMGPGNAIRINRQRGAACFASLHLRSNIRPFSPFLLLRPTPAHNPGLVSACSIPISSRQSLDDELSWNWQSSQQTLSNVMLDGPRSDGSTLMGRIVLKAVLQGSWHRAQQATYSELVLASLLSPFIGPEIPVPSEQPPGAADLEMILASLGISLDDLRPLVAAGTLPQDPLLMHLLGLQPQFGAGGGSGRGNTGGGNGGGGGGGGENEAGDFGAPSYLRLCCLVARLVALLLAKSALDDLPRLWPLVLQRVASLACLMQCSGASALLAASAETIQRCRRRMEQRQQQVASSVTRGGTFEVPELAALRADGQVASHLVHDTISIGAPGALTVREYGKAGRLGSVLRRVQQQLLTEVDQDPVLCAALIYLGDLGALEVEEAPGEASKPDGPADVPACLGVADQPSDDNPLGSGSVDTVSPWEDAAHDDCQGGWMSAVNSLLGPRRISSGGGDIPWPLLRQSPGSALTGAGSAANMEGFKGWGGNRGSPSDKPKNKYKLSAELPLLRPAPPKLLTRNPRQSDDTVPWLGGSAERQRAPPRPSQSQAPQRSGASAGHWSEHLSGSSSLVMLRSALRTARTRGERAEGQADRLAAELSSSWADTQFLRKSVQRQNEEMVRLAAESEFLSSELLALHKQVTAANGALEVGANEASQHAAQVSLLRSELTSTQESLDHAHMLLTEARNQAAAATTQAEAALAEAGSARADKNREHMEVVVLGRELARARSEATQREAELASLLARMELLQAQLRALHVQLEASAQELGVKTRAHGDAILECQTLRSKLFRTEKDLLSANAQLGTLSTKQGSPSWSAGPGRSPSLDGMGIARGAAAFSPRSSSPRQHSSALSIGGTSANARTPIPVGNSRLSTDGLRKVHSESLDPGGKAGEAGGAPPRVPWLKGLTELRPVPVQVGSSTERTAGTAVPSGGQLDLVHVEAAEKSWLQEQKQFTLPRPEAVEQSTSCPRLRACRSVGSAWRAGQATPHPLDSRSSIDTPMHEASVMRQHLPPSAAATPPTPANIPPSLSAGMGCVTADKSAASVLASLAVLSPESDAGGLSWEQVDAELDSIHAELAEAMRWNGVAKAAVAAITSSPTQAEPAAAVKAMAAVPAASPSSSPTQVRARQSAAGPAEAWGRPQQAAGATSFDVGMMVAASNVGFGGHQQLSDGGAGDHPLGSQSISFLCAAGCGQGGTAGGQLHSACLDRLSVADGGLGASQAASSDMDTEQDQRHVAMAQGSELYSLGQQQPAVKRELKEWHDGNAHTAQGTTGRKIPGTDDIVGNDMDVNGYMDTCAGRLMDLPALAPAALDSVASPACVQPMPQNPTGFISTASSIERPSPRLPSGTGPAGAGPLGGGVTAPAWASQHGTPSHSTPQRSGVLLSPEQPPPSVGPSSSTASLFGGYWPQDLCCMMDGGFSPVKATPGGSFHRSGPASFPLKLGSDDGGDAGGLLSISALRAQQTEGTAWPSALTASWDSDSSGSSAVGAKDVVRADSWGTPLSSSDLGVDSSVAGQRREAGKRKQDGGTWEGDPRGHPLVAALLDRAVIKARRGNGCTDVKQSAVV